MLRIAHRATAARLTQVHQLDKDVAVACADFQAAQDAAVLRDERLAMSVDEMRNVVGSTKRSLADVAETVSSFVSRSISASLPRGLGHSRPSLPGCLAPPAVYETIPRVESPPVSLPGSCRSRAGLTLVTARSTRSVMHTTGYTMR